MKNSFNMKKKKMNEDAESDDEDSAVGRISDTKKTFTSV
jgi:hypothetical protein